MKLLSWKTCEPNVDFASGLAPLSLNFTIHPPPASILNSWPYGLTPAHNTPNLSTPTDKISISSSPLHMSWE